MDENENKSKVYIQTDGQGRVTACDGGYTVGNITDFSQWIFIDEGAGDRYNLCQSNYFDGGLYTEDGVSRWVYEDGACRLRTEAEIEGDRAAAERRIRQAARDYEPGEYLTIGGTLYRVELPIYAGSQITPGTNVTETTMEAEMANLNKEV